MAKTAYELEILRQKLAGNRNLNKLKTLYKANLPEIKDLNRPRFWDQKYQEMGGLSKQDSMTRDRILTVANFIPAGKVRILDIAAGVGWLEEIISRDKQKEIYACDFSKVAVARLKKQFKGSFSAQSVYNLKYPKKSFDAVIVLELLEHIPPSKTFKVLKDVNMLLRKNGILIVSVPMNEGLEKMEENLNGHVRMYTEDLIKAELEIAGFKTVEYKILYAFGNYYKIKTFIANIFHTHKPNNVIVKAIKI